MKTTFDEIRKIGLRIVDFHQFNRMKKSSIEYCAILHFTKYIAKIEYCDEMISYVDEFGEYAKVNYLDAQRILSCYWHIIEANRNLIAYINRNISENADECPCY